MLADYPRKALGLRWQEFLGGSTLNKRLVAPLHGASRQHITRGKQATARREQIATAGSCDARGPATFSIATAMLIQKADATRLRPLRASSSRCRRASRAKCSDGLPNSAANRIVSPVPPVNVAYQCVNATVASLSRTFHSVRCA